MTESTGSSAKSALSRRNFLRSSLIAGTSAAVVRSAWAQEPSDKLQIALIGCGAQGTVLTDALSAIQNPAEQVHIKAVCDIHQRSADGLAGTARQRGNDTQVYTNAEEMFAAEDGKIDAVLVATPDFVHHVYAIMAMENNCDVYCEKMMSNRIATARDIVLASQQQNPRQGRKRICQIGHQRRSNPRYRAAKYRLQDDLGLFGRMIASYAQWNRSLSSSLPKTEPSGRGRAVMPSDDVLRRYGFTGGKIAGHDKELSPLYHYLNWRMFKEYGAGALSDLGAHQIDLFAWFLSTLPSRVSAQGGVDFFNNEEVGLYELPDTAQVLYEFETELGKSNCIYQVLTTNGSQGSHERWQGTNGTLVLGEVASDWNSAYRDESIDLKVPSIANPEAWKQAEAEGLIGKQNDSWRNFWEEPTSRPDSHGGWQVQGEGSFVDARVSAAPGEYDLLTNFTTPPHEPHLRNFFNAVRAGRPEDLNCPAEEGFKTTVIVLKVYEALATGDSVKFNPEDFIASPGPTQEPGMLANSPTPAQTAGQIPGQAESLPPIKSAPLEVTTPETTPDASLTPAPAEPATPSQPQPVAPAAIELPRPARPLDLGSSSQ